MTPEYETWGQVLQFFSPEDANGRPVRSHMRTGGRRSRAPIMDRGGDQKLGTPTAPPQPRATAQSPEDRPESEQTDKPRDNSNARPAEGASVHPKILDRQMQASLGRHLRAMFDDVAKAPIPDRFLKLLQDLENKESDR